MDRAYTDFERLYTLHQAGSFFVTRAKVNLDFRRVRSDDVNRTSGLICDQTIALSGYYSKRLYPAHLRRIRFKDPESGKTLIFLDQPNQTPRSDNLRPVQGSLAGRTVLQMDHQHLRIKRFYGTSENAVKTQIWIAVSVYVLVAIIKKRLNLDASLYYFVAGFFSHPFREDAHPANICGPRLQGR